LLGYKKGHIVPFISVYGRSGSGKSTIVKYVLENIDKNILYRFANWVERVSCNTRNYRPEKMKQLSARELDIFWNILQHLKFVIEDELSLLCWSKR
jgi:uridine kinase